MFFKSDKDTALKNCKGICFFFYSFNDIDYLVLFVDTLKSLQREYEQLENKMDQDS